MNRYISKTFKLLLIVIFLFWPPTFFYLSYNAKRMEKERESQKGSALMYIEKHTTVLLNNGLYREACSYLKQSYTNHDLMAYGVESDSIQCFMPEDLSFDSFPIKEPNKINLAETSKGNVAYKQISIGTAKVLLVDLIGNRLSIMSLFSLDPVGMIIGMLVDSVIAAWLVVAIWVLFVLRNIESMRSLYRQSHKPPFWFKPIHSLASLLDSNAEANSTNIQIAIAKEIVHLKEERTYYAETLEYAILDDIRKTENTGIVLPYKFFGTVARIDINGYSQYVYDGNRPFLAEMKKSFEWLAAEYAFRYKGLFEGRAGDMVVYVFRGKNAELRAAAFVRDFSAAFSDMRFSFLREKNVQLFVKASIASSELEMEASPSKFDFDGDSLYLTDRMFGELSPELKTRNILVLFPASYNSYSELVKPSFLDTIVAKKESMLSVSYHDSYYDFRERPMLVDLFCSDFYIGEKLKWIADSHNSSASRIEVSKSISKTNAKSIPAHLSEEWLTCLERISSDSTTPSELSAAVLSLGTVLVPAKAWSKRYSLKLLSIIESLDMRATANAIEVLAKWNDIEAARSAFKLGRAKFGKSPRMLGNILLAEAIHSLTEINLQELIDMINSKNKQISESGVYAGCSLLLYANETNIIGISTFNNYYKLKNILAKQTSNSERIADLLSKVNG